MEEDIQKRGLLYLQQQRFGKKWKKVWSVLYRDSSCSISRLELFEGKDGGNNTLEKSKCKQENKKVIKLNDCIRVSEASVDGCPKECRSFLVETTEKIYVFAVEASELDEWMQRLCETAFPMNRIERGTTRRTSFQQSSEEPSMSDNSLYSGREPVMKDFKVTMRRTEVTERCGLRGQYLLRTDFDSLLLKEPKTGEVLFTWPYRFLRRFGRDKTTFSFEAGRRCESGEGSFEFDTKQGNTIFQSVESAINLQRAGLTQRQGSCGALDREPVPPVPKPSPPSEGAGVYSMLSDGGHKEVPKQHSPSRSRLETPSDKHLTGVKSLNLDMRPQPRKNQVKNFRSCPLTSPEDETYSRVVVPIPGRELSSEQEELSRPQGALSRSEESDYSLPFDNINKNVMMEALAASLSMPCLLEPEPGNKERPRPEKAEPLYDSIDESAITSTFSHKPKRKATSYRMTEHIYDEPEGCAVTQSAPSSLYDNPEEVKGNAWQKMASLNDPSGHEYPYNAHVDDYAVPKPPRRAVNLEEERGSLEVEDDDSTTYDNVLMRMKTTNMME
ncbi:docking protein 2 [Hoplias malabaricus]|uniref:docking protein 2 n=1 Tax=Hoplias malabaricus TaxID=27720 RepID=UPI003461F749